MLQLYRGEDIDLNGYDVGTIHDIWDEFDSLQPPLQEEQPSTPKRVIAALGVMAAVAGGVGHEVGQSEEDALQVSAEQIATDLNSGDRVTEPVIIEKESKLPIPKETPSDEPLAIGKPVRLSDNTFATFTFEEGDKSCKVDVVEVPANAPLEPIDENAKENGSDEIVYNLSVVYTDVEKENGKTERNCAVVVGDKSGDAADTVKIDEDNATPEQKRLLADKNFKGLLEKAGGLASEERVAYPFIDEE